jgi:hypothetical protein
MTPTWRSIGNGAKITLGIWLLLFIYCTVTAVYKDHEDLVKANKEAAKTNAQLNEKVRSLSSPSDEFREKSRRKEIRKQLGKFLTEASTLLQTACATGPTPACVNARGKLEIKIEQYLRANLESQYEERFRSHMTGWGIPWNDIQGDMNTLETFIRELE